MAPHIWSTRSDGVVVVDEKIPQLAGASLARLKRVSAQWRELFTPLAKEALVPLSWVLAFCAVESGGDPTAVSPAGAVGLLQLMPSWWRGHSKSEMMDPTRNATYGIELLRDIRKTQPQLPVVASVYNCGSDKAKNTPRLRYNAWGMCAADGYIDAVVAGNNSAILDKMSTQGQIVGTPNVGGAVTIAAVGVVSLGALIALVRSR